MSEMTDGEFLRTIEQYNVTRLRAIADLLEAMQWRDAPPDTVGDWVQMARPGKNYKIWSLETDVDFNGLRSWALPSDRWFKLPEDKR